MRAVVKDGALSVVGPKGQLGLAVPAAITMQLEGSTLVVARRGDSKREKALHGLTRKLAANMVRGVSKGFTRTLEINGVGYRAEVKGNALSLSLGYSHPVVYQLPAGVAAKVERQVLITLEGADRQLLGNVAAEIRRLRPPEPYKGKGIKYAEEVIRRKAGKAAAGASAG